LDLGLSDEEFWNMTPIEFHALVERLRSRIPMSDDERRRAIAQFRERRAAMRR